MCECAEFGTARDPSVSAFGSEARTTSVSKLPSSRQRYRAEVDVDADMDDDQEGAGC